MTRNPERSVPSLDSEKPIHLFLFSLHTLRCYPDLEVLSRPRCYQDQGVIKTNLHGVHLISNTQYGFIKGRSCLACLLKTLEMPSGWGD